MGLHDRIIKLNKELKELTLSKEERIELNSKIVALEEENTVLKARLERARTDIITVKEDISKNQIDIANLKITGVIR